MNMIDWAPSATAMHAADGWVGDVPLFRIYLHMQGSEVAVLHNLTQLGLDGESDKEFSYRKLSSQPHPSLDAARFEAETWFKERILDRMELVKNPELLRMEEDLKEAGAVLRSAVEAPEEEMMARLGTVIATEERRRQSARLAAGKARAAEAREQAENEAEIRAETMPDWSNES